VISWYDFQRWSVERGNSGFVFGIFTLDSTGGSSRGSEALCFSAFVQKNLTLVKLRINPLPDPAVVNKQDPMIEFQEAKIFREKARFLFQFGLLLDEKVPVL